MEHFPLEGETRGEHRGVYVSEEPCRVGAGRCGAGGPRVLTCRGALDQSPGGTCAHWEEMVLAGRPQMPRPEVHGVLQERREMGEGKRGCLGGMG